MLRACATCRYAVPVGLPLAGTVVCGLEFVYEESYLSGTVPERNAHAHGCDLWLPRPLAFAIPADEYSK